MKKIIFTLILYFSFLCSLNALNTVSYNDYINKTAFNKFYNDTLITPDEYLLTTIENKIDLLTKEEYEIIGTKSYLNNNSESLTKSLNENSEVYYIDSNGNVNTTDQNAQKDVKVTMYVLPETRVTGYGTKTRPYKFVSTKDINFTQVYINGERSESGAPKEGKYEMSSICTGAVAKWDNDNYEVILDVTRVPVSCQLWFKSI